MEIDESVLRLVSSQEGFTVRAHWEIDDGENYPDVYVFPSAIDANGKIVRLTREEKNAVVFKNEDEDKIPDFSPPMSVRVHQSMMTLLPWADVSYVIVTLKTYEFNVCEFVGVKK